MKHRAEILRRILELLCLVLLAGMIVFLILRWGRLPDRVPGHFNAAGEIDRWGKKSELLVLPVVAGALYFMMTGVSALLRGLSGSGQLPASAGTWFAGMKLAAMAVLVFISVCTALPSPLPKWFLPAALVAAFAPLAGFAACCVRHGARP